MTSDHYVIETRHLCKSYGNSLVLDDVNFQIARGSVVGLLGVNGCGKSTLMKCLLGLLKISSGSATVLGEDPWNLSAEAKCRIGYVPQVLQGYPWMTVDHMIEYTAAHYPNWDSRRAEALRIQWEVPVREKVSALSTGQLQRLGIVLALGHHPELLILDEPAASLDPAGRRQLLSSLLEQVVDQNQTALFSTHITSDLERVASHVAILQSGRISYFGALDDLKDSVKRLRISSSKLLPSDFTVPGALRLELNGNSAVAAVTEAEESLPGRLADQWEVQVTVEDLNLEDIFLEFHHGSE